MAFREHFYVNLVPSRAHLLLLVTLHFSMALVSLLEGLAPLYRLLILSVSLLSFIYHYRAYRRIASFDTLDFNALGIRLISTKNNREVESLLEQELYLSPWVIIFLYRDNADRKRSFILFRDALHRDDFRHLFVLLKTKAHRFQSENTDIDA